MKSRLLPILFLVIVCNPLFANIYKQKIDSDIKKLIGDKKVKLSKANLYLAEHINSIYKIIQGGYFNEKLINKTYAEVSKSIIFKPFEPWLKDIKQLLKYSNEQELAKFCNGFSAEISKVLIEKILIESKQEACANKFSNNVLNNYDAKKGLSKEGLQYFVNNVQWFTASGNLENTVFLLNLLQEKNQYDYINFSEALSKYYMAHKKIPPDKLLTAMEITADLTKFIQIKGFDQNSTQSIFYRELDKLTDVLREGVEEDNSTEKSETITRSEHVVNFFTLNFENLPSSSSQAKLLSVGKILCRRAKYKSARNLFHAVFEANSEYKEEAAFELIWTHLEEKGNSAALKEVVRLGLFDKIESIQESKLLFWMGNIMQTEDPTKAKLIFGKIISKDPLSFYAVMAAKNLQDKYKLTPDKIFEKYLESNQIEKNLSLSHLSTNLQNSLVRLKAWSQLDSKVFLKLESDDIIDTHSRDIVENNPEQGKSIAFLLVSSVFNETDNHLEAFKHIYRGINEKSISLNFSVLNNLFPKPFWKQIKKLASEAFDPTIALSLIRQESGFNPKAKSIVGARGLMQIMPATARRFKHRIKPAQLENPYVNMKIGTTYFKKLLSKYDDNLVLALSAYNAGEGRVSQWKNNYFTHKDSILRNIESIPFKETRNYVKLIFRNIFFYKLLTTEPDITDGQDNNKIFNVYLGFNH